MTEDPSPDDDAPTEEPADDTDQFDPERAQAKIKKANSEAAALRKRLKDAEAKAARLDEIEEAGKTEAERTATRLAELERTTAEAESRAIRAEVAYEKGLKPELAKRLTGATREELEADADELASLTQGTDPSGRPRERLTPGAVPDAGPELSTRDFLERVPRSPF